MLHKLTLLLSAAFVLAAPLATATRSHLSAEVEANGGRVLLSAPECTRDGDCNDNLGCTRDRCQFGTCVNSPRNDVCGRFADKKNKCLTSICDPDEGCVNAPVPDGTECQIEQRCDRPRCADNTRQGTCDSGICCARPTGGPRQEFNGVTTDPPATIQFVVRNAGSYDIYTATSTEECAQCVGEVDTVVELSLSSDGVQLASNDDSFGAFNVIASDTGSQCGADSLISGVQLEPCVVYEVLVREFGFGNGGVTQLVVEPAQARTPQPFICPV